MLEKKFNKPKCQLQGIKKSSTNVSESFWGRGLRSVGRDACRKRQSSEKSIAHIFLKKNSFQLFQKVFSEFQKHF